MYIYPWPRTILGRPPTGVRIDGVMELSKPHRKELRSLLGIGHVRLLADELRNPDHHFLAWKVGELDAFDLNEMIHAIHEGPSR